MKDSICDFGVPQGPDRVERVKGSYAWRDCRRGFGLQPFSRAPERRSDAAARSQKPQFA